MTVGRLDLVEREAGVDHRPHGTGLEERDGDTRDATAAGELGAELGEP